MLPIEQTPALPAIATAQAQPSTPISQTPNVADSTAENNSPSATRNFSERTSTPAPMEQAVTLKVNTEQPKIISQPVALDVKFTKPPQLEIPLSLAVKLPSDAERKIPVVFAVDSSAPLVVPIRFQAENTGPIGVRTSSDAGSATPPGGGSSLSQNELAAFAPITSDRIPIQLLAGVIVVAGLVGGTLRTLEARRAIKQRVAKLKTGDRSKLTFEERMRATEHEAQSLQAADMTLLFFANIIWGLLAAALVPACLVVARHPLLLQIAESRAHLLALFGFCLLAATIGAELLARVQRALLGGSGSHETDHASSKSRPLSHSGENPETYSGAR
jgi:hypothetical protein